MTLILTQASHRSPSNVSPRLQSALTSADVILAADDSGPRRLLDELGIDSTDRAISYRGGLPPEPGKGDSGLSVDDWGRSEVARAIDPGVVVAIVDRSEAAALLTRMAIERDVAVTVVPGPDPVVAAVTMSGLPSERFCYEGAPASSSPARRAAFADLEAERRTMVFLLEPGRRAEALADLVAAFGDDRPAALCQGLVRSGEQVHRAPLGELAGRWSEESPGSEELFLVVHGASASRRPEPSPDDLVAAVADLVQAGATPKTAIAAVAQRLDVRKRVVYDAVLQAKNRG